MMAERARTRGVGVMIIIAVVLILSGASGVLGYKFGVRAGEQRAEIETGEKLNRLGEVVEEKSYVVQAGREMLDFSAESLSETEIERFLSALKKIREKCTVKTAQETVEGLNDRLADFKEVYNEADAVAIAHEYDSLKDAVKKTEEKLNEIYNSEISTALARFGES